MLEDGDRLVRSTSRALWPPPRRPDNGRPAPAATALPGPGSPRVRLRPATGRQDAHRRWAW